MSLTIRHDLLVTGPDFESCSRRVHGFFSASQLVHYDNIEIDRARSCNGAGPSFRKQLNKALTGNQQVLAQLLGELQQAGCTRLEDLLTLPQGFQSKLVHTMAHMLDGFFGIDACFFDLDEVSYRLTENRRRQLEEQPEQCWLLGITAGSQDGQGFEGSNPK